jgi:hypothetical protein
MNFAEEAGVPEVAPLLAAAAGPATPEELRGEDAAVAAFVALRPGAPLPVSHVAPRRRWLTPRRLMVVVGAIAGASLAATAVAAGTGLLPSPFHPGAAPTSASPSGISATDGAGTAKPTHLPEGSGAVNGLRGQCVAYQHEPPERRGDKVPRGEYALLISAAGGVDNLDAYCAALLASAKPSESASPTPSTIEPTPIDTTRVHPTHPSHPSHT